MDRVRIGRTELVSSVLGLGGGSSGRFGMVKGTKADALRLIRAALDHGITFFDGAGLAGGVDEVLGEGLGARRGDVVLSTKVHLGPETFTNGAFANRASAWFARRAGWVCGAAAVRKRVEQSLRALRTDWIDVLHLHAVTPAQYPLALGRIVPELLKLKAEGKVRALGITEGFLADPSHRMLQAAAQDGRFDVLMTGFNFKSCSASRTVFPSARAADLGVIGMFALRGLGDSDEAELAELLEEAGARSLAELSYRYVRHHPGVDVVLTGTGDIDHLAENVEAAMAPPIPQHVIERLEAMFAPAGQAGGAFTRK